MTDTSIVDRLLTLPQYVAPQHALSDFIAWLTRIEQPAIRTGLIRTFLSVYDVDLGEAERSGIGEYASFNDFFTRALRDGARPLPASESDLTSPADGMVSQIGKIDGGRVMQAKGRDFSLAALLAVDAHEAERYADGNFVTIYLAPHNYHRVHAPFGGRVRSVRYVPGKLFSVNTRTARSVDELFARNERVIVEMDTSRGRIVVVLVGAMLVASMELTVCDVTGAIRSAGGRRSACDIAPRDGGDVLVRGEELGRFNMGSTVIVIGEREQWRWLPDPGPGDPVRMGQALAQ